MPFCNTRFLRCALLTGLVAGSILVPAAPAESAAPGKVDVLIAFRKVPGQAEQNLVKANGGTVRRTYQIVPAFAVELPMKAAEALAKHKDVAIIEPDGLIEAVDAELDAVWGVKKIGAGIAHTSNPAYKGLGISVAVIDSGVDYNHADLKPNYRGGYDFVNNDSDPMDDNGHGTHCAGTIAAADNDAGVVGVAPSVNLYALKVLDATGSGSYSNMIAALDWCVKNSVPIDITNNSYGSSANPGSIVETAFINAHNAGILNIAAAGNYGTSAGTEDNVIYPARYASVLAVGATTSGDVRSSFSCTGPAVELAAPGSSIYSTLPGGRYGTYSGTSMACPHAVGAAAVLLEAGRGQYGASATNEYIWDMLKASALDLGTAGSDTWYGAGRVQVDYGVATVGLTAPSAPAPAPAPAPPPAIIGMKVKSITYAAVGAKKADLQVTVTIVDQNGTAVSGAAVSAAIKCSTVSTTYGGTATTNAKGQVVYKISKAPKGTWTTTVSNVTKSGYQWDQSSPANSYQKK